jgi:hypothetical protein
MKKCAVNIIMKYEGDKFHHAKPLFHEKKMLIAFSNKSAVYFIENR